MKDLQTPPGAPIWWVATKKTDSDVTLRVLSASWFEARKSASAALDCEPGELLCEQEMP